jgi:hypothetical protein
VRIEPILATPLGQRGQVARGGRRLQLLVELRRRRAAARDRLHLGARLRDGLALVRVLHRRLGLLQDPDVEAAVLELDHVGRIDPARVGLAGGHGGGDEFLLPLDPLRDLAVQAFAEKDQVLVRPALGGHELLRSAGLRVA